MLVVSKSGRPQWHAVFENNPRIVAAPTANSQTLLNASGNRPYIAAKGVTHWTWKRWDITPGEIYLSAGEKAFAAPHAGRTLIEPNTKVPGSNKSYEWDRWQSIVDAFDRGTFIQVGQPSARRLHGVHFVETPTFRHACAVLAVSRAFVGSEGGLHHAAAAVGTPAVVIFGGFISPLVTGYPKHLNLFTGSGLGCGNMLQCSHCRDCMQRITVDDVVTALQGILAGN